MSDDAAVRFVASLAAVMYPIKKGRDGTRLTLDVPLTEQLAMMKLELLTDMAFEVTIRPVVAKVEESLGDGSPEAQPRPARSPIDVASG